MHCSPLLNCPSAPVRSQSKLRKLGAHILPVKNEFLPPQWAAPYHRGSFGKLNILRLTQFDKVVFLDSDCQVVRNIDNLASVPSPSAAFHAPDDGINSGVMVLSPNTAMAETALYAF